MEFVVGSGSELAEKLLSERAAGLYLGDIYLAGPTTIQSILRPKGAIDPMRPMLILPEVIDTKGRGWNVFLRSERER